MAQEFVNPTTPTLPQLDGLEEVAFSNEDIQSIKLGLLDDVDFNDPGYTFVQDTIPDFEKPFPAPQPNPNEFIPKQPCMNLPITIKITAEKPSKSSPTQYVMVTLLRHSKRLDVAAGQHQHFFYGLVVEDECSEGGSLMGYKTWGLLDFFARLCGKKRGYVEYQIRSCEDVKVKVRCMPFTNPNCYLWWNPPATRLEQSTDSNQFLPFAVQTPIIDGERAKYIARCVGNLSSLDPEIQFTNLFMRKRTNEEVNQPEPSAPGQVISEDCFFSSHSGQSYHNVC